jgi:hypothetical protein
MSLGMISSNTYAVRFIFELSALNSSSAQCGMGSLSRGEAGSDDGSAGTTDAARSICYGTSSEVSSNDLAITVTIDPGSTAQSFSCNIVQLELV